MIESRPYVAPDGPRWVPGAYQGLRQTDGRGVEWAVSRVESGGRVVHWYTPAPYRESRTEITPNDPRYPTDEELARERRLRKDAGKVRIY